MRTGHTTPFPQRFDALAPVVDQVFDLETVLKVSVGLRWDSMDADVQDTPAECVPPLHGRHLRRQLRQIRWRALPDPAGRTRRRRRPDRRHRDHHAAASTMRLDYVMRERQRHLAGGGRAAGGFDQPRRRPAVRLPEDPGERRRRRADRQPATQDRRPVGWRAELMMTDPGRGEPRPWPGSAWSRRWWRRGWSPPSLAGPAAPPVARPPVTVLKPLHGDEPLLERGPDDLVPPGLPELSDRLRGAGCGRSGGCRRASPPGAVSRICISPW